MTGRMCKSVTIGTCPYSLLWVRVWVFTLLYLWKHCREAWRDSDLLNELASSLVSAPYSWNRVSNEAELGVLTEGGRLLWSGLSTLVTPMWSCHALHVAHCLWLRNARSMARHWQTHLPNARADDTSLYPCVPWRYWTELWGEACRDSD